MEEYQSPTRAVNTRTPIVTPIPNAALSPGEGPELLEVGTTPKDAVGDLQLLEALVAVFGELELAVKVSWGQSYIIRVYDLNQFNWNSLRLLLLQAPICRGEVQKTISGLT